MPKWMKPTEELPGDGKPVTVGDRIVMIVMERPTSRHRIKPRLVILEATENGWTSPEDLFQGYMPEDGVLWTWERNVCDVIHGFGIACESCGGSGGGPDPAISCVACEGTGRART